VSWRTVVITKTAKLDYSMGYMVVRDVESTAKIHISEISVLVVESTAVSVTAALLNELINKKVKVILNC
jgi:CRISPR/Cas system-associated endonuclease Cas1